MSLRRTTVSVVLAFLLALAAWASPALAEEVIRSFTSDVTVRPTADLLVRETIVVRAEGNVIRRGILRDFPTVYSTRSGTRMRVAFDVQSVKRDGHSEPFTTEGMSNGVRVRIGSANVLLSRGDHTYTITYRTDRQLGFFDTYDELYWNVTGNGWPFAIEKAAVTIHLPYGGLVQQHSEYTGAMGATGRDVRVLQATGNTYRAETTRRLGPGEGMTVAVGWQKGIVTPPTAGELRARWLSDNAGLAGVIATLLAVLAYYLFAWTRVGRDPPKGNIIPQFRPPEGLGPSAVRYIWKQGYDDKAFAAGLVGLAVKGQIKIKSVDGDYSLTRESSGGPPLTRTERALTRFMPMGTLELEQSNHMRISTMRKSLETALDEEFDGTMFLRNFGWFAAGLAITAAGLLLSGFLMPAGEGALVMFTGGFSAVWWGVILVVGWNVVQGLMQSGSLAGKLKSLIGLVFLLPFVGAGLFVPAATWFSGNANQATIWFIAAAVAAALFNLLFYFLLKAPTPAGRKVLDHIEGFRLYMTTAEEKRLDALHPPDKTPELFERYLPYAMALDCENEWNAKFAAVLAAAAAAGVATAGGWYIGDRMFGTDGFSRELGTSLASTISSAGTAPGSPSSSGGGFSGGGGSSGGGGGGGGGGGW